MATRIFNKYWWIAKSLRTNQLQRKTSEELSFSESDLFSTDIGQRGGGNFLGYYSTDGINLALKKYGVIRLLKKHGFKNIITKIDASDIYKHKLSIYHEKRDAKHLLIEVVLRKEFITINLPFDNEYQGKKFEALTIDWMCMQNPLISFDEKKKQLPGQKFPGLGFSNVAVELLLNMNWRLNLAGLVNIPEHYHNAQFYSKIFKYINPETQAKFLALKKDMKHLPVEIVSWAVEWGCVTEKESNQPFVWIVDKQIVPMDVRLKKIFHSNEYTNHVAKLKKNYKFEFNDKLFEQCKRNKSRKGMENII
jgi:hypothetical protein